MNNVYNIHSHTLVIKLPILTRITTKKTKREEQKRCWSTYELLPLMICRRQHHAQRQGTDDNSTLLKRLSGLLQIQPDERPSYEVGAPSIHKPLNCR